MALETPRDDGVGNIRYSAQNGLEERYNSSKIRERKAGPDGPGVDFLENTFADGFIKNPIIGFSQFKGVGFGGNGSNFNYISRSRTPQG